MLSCGIYNLERFDREAHICFLSFVDCVSLLFFFVFHLSLFITLHVKFRISHVSLRHVPDLLAFFLQFHSISFNIKSNFLGKRHEFSVQKARINKFHHRVNVVFFLLILVFGGMLYHILPFHSLVFFLSRALPCSFLLFT